MVGRCKFGEYFERDSATSSSFKHFRPIYRFKYFFEIDECYYGFFLVYTHFFFFYFTLSILVIDGPSQVPIKTVQLFKSSAAFTGSVHRLSGLRVVDVQYHLGPGLLSTSLARSSWALFHQSGSWWRQTKKRWLDLRSSPC